MIRFNIEPESVDEMLTKFRQWWQIGKITFASGGKKWLPLFLQISRMLGVKKGNNIVLLNIPLLYNHFHGLKQSWLYYIVYIAFTLLSSWIGNMKQSRCKLLKRKTQWINVGVTFQAISLNLIMHPFLVQNEILTHVNRANTDEHENYIYFYR